MAGTALNGNAAIGQRVQITTSEMTLDPNIYRVSALDRHLVMLEIICSACDGTGLRTIEKCTSCGGTGLTGRHRVHHSRIARIFSSDGETIYDSEPIVEKEIKMATPKATPKTATSTPTESVVDVKTIRGDGEMFSKSVGFDHDSITVEANVVITKDHRSFRVFNTYNGTLGKKGKTGKVYTLADDKAYDRKVGQLSKQGYSKK
jgi:hypothetical protein